MPGCRKRVAVPRAIIDVVVKVSCTHAGQKDMKRNDINGRPYVNAFFMVGLMVAALEVPVSPPLYWCHGQLESVIEANPRLLGNRTCEVNNYLENPQEYH